MRHLAQAVRSKCHPAYSEWPTIRILIFYCRPEADYFSARTATTKRVQRTECMRDSLLGSMPFCVELDNLKDTDAPIQQPAAMLVAAD